MMTELVHVQIDCEYCPSAGTAADGFVRDNLGAPAPVCADCWLAIIQADWDRIEARALAYQLEDATLWQRLRHHRQHRRMAHRLRTSVQTLQQKRNP